MFVIINPLLVLLMIHPSLTLSSSSLPNPHGPQKLTWEVVSPSGSVAWSTSDTRVPGTWWPSLHPDVCQIVLGLDTWDLPNQDAVPHPSTVPEPFLYPPGSTTTMGAGCRYRVRRCRLRQLEFYVCPKDGRRQDQIFRCGGPESLYCKAWGCETTGVAHWGPSSVWDWITVQHNFTPEDPGQCSLLLPGSWGSTSPCASSPTCNPLNITFTTSGKQYATLSSWIKGRIWGLRYYVSGTDFGFWFKIRLRITSPDPLPVGPNRALAPAYRPPRPEMTKQLTSKGTGSPAPTSMRTGSPVPLASLPAGERAMLLIRGAFSALNLSHPNLTNPCWLCLSASPPYYEGVAVVGTFNTSLSHRQCPAVKPLITLAEVSGRRSCVGDPPSAYRCLCNTTANSSLVDQNSYLVPPPPEPGGHALAASLPVCPPLFSTGRGISVSWWHSSRR